MVWTIILSSFIQQTFMDYLGCIKHWAMHKRYDITRSTASAGRSLHSDRKNTSGNGCKIRGDKVQICIWLPWIEQKRSYTCWEERRERGRRRKYPAWAREARSETAFQAEEKYIWRKTWIKVRNSRVIQVTINNLLW